MGLKELGRRVHFVAIALDMLLCSILFFPWFQPRETLCGLVGRWRVRGWGWKREVARVGCWILDKTPLHSDHEDCVVIYLLEEAARKTLYRPEELP